MDTKVIPNYREFFKLYLEVFMKKYSLPLYFNKPEKALPQVEHTKFLMPLWAAMWSSNLLRRMAA